MEEIHSTISSKIIMVIVASSDEEWEDGVIAFIKKLPLRTVVSSGKAVCENILNNTSDNITL